MDQNSIEQGLGQVKKAIVEANVRVHEIMDNVATLEQQTKKHMSIVKDKIILKKRRQRQKNWCVADADGVFGLIFGYATILFALYQCTFNIIIPWSSLMIITRLLLLLIYWSIVGIAIWCHLTTMLTNPGAIPLGGANQCEFDDVEECEGHDDEEDAQTRWCKICNQYKPPRAHHCRRCNRCILKMDHHCPWMNNCVGANNQKHFILFNMYIAIMSSFTLILTGLQVLGIEDELSYRRKEAYLGSTPFLLLNMLGVLFALFTSGMFMGQLISVIEDQTLIEQKKEQRARLEAKSRGEKLSDNLNWKTGKKSVKDAFIDVFGGDRPNWKWLLPFSVEKKGNMILL